MLTALYQGIGRALHLLIVFAHRFDMPAGGRYSFLTKSYSKLRPSAAWGIRTSASGNGTERR